MNRWRTRYTQLLRRLGLITLSDHKKIIADNTSVVEQRERMSARNERDRAVSEARRINDEIIDRWVRVRSDRDIHRYMFHITTDLSAEYISLHNGQRADIRRELAHYVARRIEAELAHTAFIRY